MSSPGGSGSSHRKRRMSEETEAPRTPASIARSQTTPSSQSNTGGYLPAFQLDLERNNATIVQLELQIETADGLIETANNAYGAHQSTLKDVTDRVNKKKEKMLSLQTEIADDETEANNIQTKMTLLGTDKTLQERRKADLVEKLNTCKERKAYVEQCINQVGDFADATIEVIRSGCILFLSQHMPSVRSDTPMTFGVLDDANGAIRKALWHHLSHNGFGRNTLCSPDMRSNSPGFEDKLVCVENKKATQVLMYLASALQVVFE